MSKHGNSRESEVARAIHDLAMTIGTQARRGRRLVAMVFDADAPQSGYLLTDPQCPAPLCRALKDALVSVWGEEIPGESEDDKYFHNPRG
jgi:hypothetical protein